MDELSAHDLGQWVIVGNIVKTARGGPDSKLQYYGTKVFAPGAKVYIAYPLCGGVSYVCVIGQHRKSKKLSACVISISTIENMRAKVVYSESVLKKLLTLNQDQETKKFQFNGRNPEAGHSCLLKSEAECAKTLNSLMLWSD